VDKDRVDHYQLRLRLGEGGVEKRKAGGDAIGLLATQQDDAAQFAGEKAQAVHNDRVGILAQSKSTASGCVRASRQATAGRW
jgi:hypothetical protein